MARYLLVANQTLGGQDLDDALRARLAGGGGEVHVVVPRTAPRYESSAWRFGYQLEDGIGDAAIRELVRDDEEQREAALQEAELRAQERLRRMLEAIRALGAVADGVVGDADPVRATRTALEEHDVDEVLISTLPPGVSRWLKMDLPSRVARMTDVPVTTIVATEAAAEQG